MHMTGPYRIRAAEGGGIVWIDKRLSSVNAKLDLGVCIKLKQQNIVLPKGTLSNPLTYSFGDVLSNGWNEQRFGRALYKLSALTLLLVIRFLQLIYFNNL